MLRIYFIQFKPNSHADRVYFITSFTTASFLYHVEKRHSKRRCWNCTFVSFLYWDMSGTKCADKLLHTARNEIFTGLAHFWAVCVKLIWSRGFMSIFFTSFHYWTNQNTFPVSCSGLSLDLFPTPFLAKIVISNEVL